MLFYLVIYSFEYFFLKERGDKQDDLSAYNLYNLNYFVYLTRYYIINGYVNINFSIGAVCDYNSHNLGN